MDGTKTSFYQPGELLAQLKLTPHINSFFMSSFYKSTFANEHSHITSVAIGRGIWDLRSRFVNNNLWSRD
jgi:hypothetical protein